MREGISVLVVLSLGLIWGAFGALLMQAVLMPTLTTVMICGLGFLASTNLYGVLTRARDRGETARAIARVSALADEARREADEAKHRMAEMAAALEERFEGRSERLIGEVKVLEALIRDFADGIAERVRTLETQTLDPKSLEARLATEVRSDGPSYVEGLGEPQLLAEIRRSLIDNRVDLYLQPIVSLPQRRLRFYEAFTRLRMADGSLIMPAQYLSVAEAAGLMSAIDNLLLFRCVQVIRRLAKGAREISIFCNISAYSLSDRTFFPQFLEFMAANKDLSGHIIFELSEEALRDVDPLKEHNLRALGELGFAFSLDRLSSLDLDFGRLREFRVRYVKSPAHLLLGEEVNPDGIAMTDVKDLFGRHGMSLIAERVEEEREVVNLLDLGVDYGQGYLFGEPRPIRDATSEEPAAPRVANL